MGCGMDRDKVMLVWAECWNWNVSLSMMCGGKQNGTWEKVATGTGNNRDR